MIKKTTDEIPMGPKFLTVMEGSQDPVPLLGWMGCRAGSAQLDLSFLLASSSPVPFLWLQFSYFPHGMGLCLLQGEEG